MISFGNAASSHSGLIPLKTAYKKKRGIAPGDREAAFPKLIIRLLSNANERFCNQSGRLVTRAI